MKMTFTRMSAKTPPAGSGVGATPGAFSVYSDLLNEISDLHILPNKVCEELANQVLNFDSRFDLCAARKQRVAIENHPFYKVQN